MVVTPPPPSPAHDAQAVADKAAKAIDSFSQWFGPYPYSSLALTQMPGNLSQGWPGLVFLSSFAFLSPQEQTDLHLDPVTRALDSQVLVHETAHQWWGDLVLWNSYRDQWIAEGLAELFVAVLLEQQNPAQFRQVLENYRRDLLSKNKDGEWLRDAGPVTLGHAAGVVAFSRRIRSHQLRTRHVAVSHAALHVARFRSASRPGIPRRHRSEGRTSMNSDEPFFRACGKSANDTRERASAPKNDASVSKRNCRAHFGTRIVPNWTGFWKVGSKARRFQSWKPAISASPRRLA